jgi:hypothetical protein
MVTGVIATMVPALETSLDPQPKQVVAIDLLLPIFTMARVGETTEAMEGARLTTATEPPEATPALTKAATAKQTVAQGRETIET